MPQQGGALPVVLQSEEGTENNLWRDTSLEGIGAAVTAPALEHFLTENKNG